jgi:hypothetical protein
MQCAVSQWNSSSAAKALLETGAAIAKTAPIAKPKSLSLRFIVLLRGGPFRRC